MRRFIVSGMVVALSTTAWLQVTGAASWPDTFDVRAKIMAGAIALSVTGVAVVVLVIAFDVVVGVAQFIRRLYRFCMR